MIELSLHRDYCPGWGRWEGIRDLVQNQMDGADRGFAGEIRYDKAGKLLVLTNVGASIPREKLLLGFSDKRGDANQRGEHGEGLKLALLALTRAGLKVKVFTGTGELLLPEIGRSASFDAEVLRLRVTKTKISPMHEIRVFVGGLEQSDWIESKARFLALTPPEKMIETSRGSIILDENRKGQVFVGGIYVCTDDRMAFGYDFKIMKLDRDRKIPDQWESRWQMAQMVSEALDIEKVDPERVLDMLQDGSQETDNLRYFVAPKSRGRVAAAFLERHGKNAVPVTPGFNRKALEAAGGLPVELPSAAVEALVGEGGLKSADVFLSESKTWIKQIVPLASLDEWPRLRLLAVQAVFARMLTDRSGPIVVATFRDENTEICTSEDRGRKYIMVARWLVEADNKEYGFNISGYMVQKILETFGEEGWIPEKYAVAWLYEEMKRPSVDYVAASALESQRTKVEEMLTPGMFADGDLEDIGELLKD